MRKLLSVLFFLLLGGMQVCALPPAPPQVDTPLIDNLLYQDTVALQAAWQPMGKTAPVSVVEWNDQRALRMPCSFKGTQLERASWDHAVTLDLTACRGVQFDFYCENLASVAFFSCYLHCAGGWYATTFTPENRTGWSRVIITKTGTRLEGAPAGWGAIDTIRISAWRGNDVDTACYLANLRLEGADAPIAIIRGESVGKSLPNEAATVTACTKTVAEMLDTLGLPYVVMSDLDATADRLKGKLIAILPHNPGMPDPVAGELLSFMKNGGKLLVCYQMPAQLADACGISAGAYLKETYRGYFASIRTTGDGLPGLPATTGQASWNILRAKLVEGRSRVVATWFTDKGESTREPAIVASDNCVYLSHVLLADDPAAKRIMLLAMLGYLDQRLWEQAVEKSLQRVGQFGHFTDFAEVARVIRREAQGNPDAITAIAKAETLLNDAVKTAKARHYPAAMSAAAAARETALLAYCRAQKAKTGEHRAWWCHSAFGVTGMSWEQAIKNLADNGFTAILPNMLWGGVAYYAGDVLPVAPEVKTRGDQLAACVAACRKYGVQCHVWKVNWNMGYNVPADFLERMQREGRIQVGYDGKPEPRWLCPSNPANQQLEIDSMVEVATKYDVDGVHFDYIRYPSGQYCYCAGCRERFEAVLGKKVVNWPADTRNDPAVRQQWLDFRRGNITRVVASVHDAVKKIKPKVQISAAVFPNWPVDRDVVGQDWKLWCERGYLDFVCPMDYTPGDAQFETLLDQQRAWAGNVPCYPGIGLSTWSGELDVARLIAHIDITRRLGAGGFTVFNYSAAEAAGIVPLCGQGITRKVEMHR